MPHFARYRDLQAYVGWTPDDAEQVRAVGPLITPFFSQLIDDFYAEIQHHPDAHRVITGGDVQIERLKTTLLAWLAELFSGVYDSAYVERRWRVGHRHVDIGLNQAFTNAALSRLRRGLLHSLETAWTGSEADLRNCRASLNTLLDLDLAIIEDAYQSEYQQRQVAAERLRSEQKSQALFENALDGLIIFDAEELITEANSAACCMLNKTRQHLIGQKLVSLLATSNLNQPKKNVFTTKNHTGEFRLLRSDGCEIDVEYQTTLNFSPDCNAVSLRDVTERKRSEQRAMQAERLAAIGETMAALVHESRNALQRSFACLEMLELEVEDRPAAIDLVARTRRAQDQLRQLYEEVREWAAPINLTRHRSDLTHVWREAWQHVVQVQRSKQVRLLEEVSCETWCRIDSAKMGQVFRNIFENAVEVSPERSTIVLHCALAGTPEHDALRITISDHGPGLSAEQATRMFEPFFTTKAKGTGLGLAIAKRIVQAHFGRISAILNGSPSQHSTAIRATGACLEIIIPRGVA